MAGIEEELIERLRSRGWMLAVTESATGGLVSRRITGVAGCSDVYWGAVIAYANSAKEKVLGVPKKLILENGAVSEEVARAMAETGMNLMKRAQPGPLAREGEAPKAYACVSTTGIAGPSGGSEKKPVGLCFISLAVSGRETRTIKVQAPGGATREECQRLFADRALELALSGVSEK